MLALTVSGLLGLALAALAGVLLAARAMRPTAQALAMQRRFVADASHELRTPLTLLSTRAQLVRRELRAGTDPATLADEVDGLVVDARNLGNVLEDLLVAVDPRTHQRRERVDVGRLAGEVAAAAAAAARAEGVDVRCTRGGGNRFTGGAGGAGRLGRRSSPRPHRARRQRCPAREQRGARDGEGNAGARGRRRERRWPGIEAELIPRLFDRYETAQPAGSAQRGYGLGLALVSEIATSHGGTVTARNIERSGPDGTSAGALLELTLPRRKSH